MARKLSVEEMIKMLRYCAETTSCSHCYWGGEMCMMSQRSKIADALENLSERVPAHKGHWIDMGDSCISICSECGSMGCGSRYCPECGA